MSRHYTSRGATPLQKLEGRSIPVTECGCIIWLGYVKPNNGYGQVNIEGRAVLTHRAAYEAAIGPIPHGLSVLHRCDIPTCINPDHLFLGTQTINIADKIQKDRHPYGDRCSYSKLTAIQVGKIRASHDRTGFLAKKYGVSPATICDVKQRRSWRQT